MKEFDVTIDGVTSRFTARTDVNNDVCIYEAGAETPSVVLMRSNMMERALSSLIDQDELIGLAISQATNDGLIVRARQEGRPVREAIAFVPHEM